MGISEKAAYLKGLVEGSNLGFNDSQQKVVDALLDLIQDMATAVTDIEGIIKKPSDSLIPRRFPASSP